MDKNQFNDLSNKINAIVNSVKKNINSTIHSKYNDKKADELIQDKYTIFDKLEKSTQEKLKDLGNYLEWDTFTIAFYGETNAGKSTLIETLRLLLDEPTKVAAVKKFHELYDHAYKAIKDADSKISNNTYFIEQLQNIKEQINKFIEQYKVQQNTQENLPGGGY